jgi:hypothetical protein
VAGAPAGTLVSAGAGVWLGVAGAVVSFGDADARAVSVGEAFAVEAFAVDVAEALSVDAGELAFALCRAVVPGEALAVPVCVLVDVAGVKIAGAVLPGELVHAQISAEARIAKVALCMAVSLALAAVPGVIMRTFMKPPYMRAARPYR